MPAITIEGKNSKYLFSVIEADTQDLPDWGGIYIAVKSSVMGGLRMEDCIAIGSCVSFSKYGDKIHDLVDGKSTHLFLLPEFEVTRRKITLQDLMETPAFRDVALRTLEAQTLYLEDWGDKIRAKEEKDREDTIKRAKHAEEVMHKFAKGA